MNRNFVIAILLAACTLIAYWQIKENDFVLADDPTYIIDNQHVKGGISFDGLVWAITTEHAANWHPVTWVSHMIDWDLYGNNPSGHHISNVIIHVMSTILLFIAFSRMTGSPWKSGFVAAVFALHPLHVESVAWAAERKDVLAGLFWILTVLSYNQYVKKKDSKHYLLTLAFYALGLMSKPMLVTLPFVLLLLDYWPLNRFQYFKESWGKHLSEAEVPTRRFHLFWIPVREKIPFFFLAVVSSIITLVVQQHGGAVSSWNSLSFASRLSNATAAYLDYIGKAFWPTQLAVFYPHPMSSLPLWQAIACGLFLVVVSLLAFRFRKDFPSFLVGWFWFLGTLVPVIGIVQVGEQSMADRYMYIPLIGLSITVAWGTDLLPAKWRHRKIVLTILATITVFFLMSLTWIQVGYWRNTLTLFDHANRVTTNNYVAVTNIGIVLQSDGKTDAAINLYDQALQFNPSYELARYNLAVAFQSKGDGDRAISQYREVLRLKSNSAESHYGLAMILGERGENLEAIDHYKRALQINPEYWEAHFGLGLAYTRADNLDSAITHLVRTLQINPDYPYAHFQLAAALHQKGRLQDAIRHYSEAIQKKADYAAAYANLGAALHQQGRLNEAIEKYQQALKLNPYNDVVHTNLQAALQSQKQQKQ